MVRASEIIERPARERRRTRLGPYSKMSASRPEARRGPGDDLIALHPTCGPGVVAMRAIGPSWPIAGGSLDRARCAVGFYRDHVLPRVANVLLFDGEHGKVRKRVASGPSGVVLEVGFGSGLNVSLNPSGLSASWLWTRPRLGGSYGDQPARSVFSRSGMQAVSDHHPTAPSRSSRIRSAWPLCRAYSSIMWT